MLIVVVILLFVTLADAPDWWWLFGFISLASSMDDRGGTGGAENG